MIEDQGLIWKFVLNAIILTTRPRRKGLDYEKIWNRERNESPLKTITRSQAGKLRAALGQLDRGIVVDWAMRYGNPSLDSRLEALVEARLRPHRAGAALSAIRRGDHRDGVRRGVRDARRACASSRRCASCRPITTIRSISTRWRLRSRRSSKALPFAPEMILASFHGIPKSYADEGDPYPQQCAETVRLLRARLGLDEQQADADVPVALRPRRMAHSPTPTRR